MKATKKTSGSQAASLAATLAGESTRSEATISRSIALPSALAFVAVAALAILVMAAPRSAHASESPYCPGASVPAKEYCFGAPRTFDAEVGWGDQGSVCVGNGVSGSACSGGPGQGVYKPVGEWIYAQPWIFNNLPGRSGTVHGVAYTP